MTSAAPHPFTLRQLQYALAVAEALSFRKAAERCHVSQPSLSAQIAQLEGALGVTLFERDRRRVLLTHAGQEIIERARRAVLAADDVEAATQRLRDPLSGTLRVGVIPTISPYLLPVVTPPLRAEYPRLTIVWVEDKTAVLRRQLETGALEAALLAWTADLGEVDHALVAEDPFVLAAPAGHRLGRPAKPASPAELRDEPVLLLDEGHCFREQALAVCSLARAQEPEFRATSLSTLVQMVAGGAGVTLLPRIAVATEAARAGLTVRPFAKPAPHRTIVLVWRRRSPLSSTLDRVAAALRKAAESLDRHRRR